MQHSIKIRIIYKLFLITVSGFYFNDYDEIYDSSLIDSDIKPSSMSIQGSSSYIDSLWLLFWLTDFVFLI